MLLATADSRDGYVSVAAQVVQAYAPVGTAEFGDGGGAVMAVEAKYRLDGESRMQELHDQDTGAARPARQFTSDRG